MVQATTPTFVLTLPDTVDLSEAENVYFTIRQGHVFMTKTGEDITVDGNTVYVPFTQAETLRLLCGIAAIQLNWVYADGKRACSNIVNIKVDPNLIMEVLS
jgi:hypothetical protein